LGKSRSRFHKRVPFFIVLRKIATLKAQSSIEESQKLKFPQKLKYQSLTFSTKNKNDPKPKINLKNN